MVTVGGDPSTWGPGGGAVGSDPSTWGPGGGAANPRNPLHFDGIERRGNFLAHSKLHHELLQTG